VDVITSCVASLVSTQLTDDDRGQTSLSFINAVKLVVFSFTSNTVGWTAPCGPGAVSKWVSA